MTGGIAYGKPYLVALTWFCVQVLPLSASGKRDGIQQVLRITGAIAHLRRSLPVGYPGIGRLLFHQQTLGRRCQQGLLTAFYLDPVCVDS